MSTQISSTDRALSPAPEMLDLKEAARLLKVSTKHLRRWIKSGRLNAHLVGRRGYRISKENLLVALESSAPSAKAAVPAAQPVEPAPPPPPPRYLTVNEAAALVKVSPNTIKQWIDCRRLTAYQAVGSCRRGYRIDREDLLSALTPYERRRMNAVAAAEASDPNWAKRLRRLRLVHRIPMD